MPFFPIGPGHDDRSKFALTPIVMKNVYLEPQPEGAAKRSSYAVVPTFGMTARVTPSAGSLVRGAFCRPGVQNNLLFAVCGDTLYSIDDAWTATICGVVGGTGRVLMDAIGANLVVLSSGALFIWDGSSLTGVADPDFPANAITLASLADRVLVSEQGSDTFDWSAVGDGTNWPATGFAASARYPDEIRAQLEVAGDLVHFGAASTQFWRAQGGADADAFDVLSSIIINRGIIGRDACAKLDSYAMFIGDDRVAYEMNGYVPTRVINHDLESALMRFGDPEVASVQCFSYYHGSYVHFAVRLPDGKSYVFDAKTRRWHQRTAFGDSNRFDIVYATRFFGFNVVASSDNDTIYTWDEGVYTDDGASIERVAMVHVPSQGRTPISNITLDIKVRDQPLVGTGSDPKAHITFYKDGGSLDSLQQLGIERSVSLGARGQYNVRPTLWRLGLANAIDGLLLKIRISDPIGFALTGVWVNEIPT